MIIKAIGDTHGRDYWKKVAALDEPFDKLVFIGDYFDSFDIPGRTQIENFKEILDYKRVNKDKVVLLIGNHDYHYFKFTKATEKYSGYQFDLEDEISDLLQVALDEHLLQVAFQHDKALFTHAGLTNTWAKNNFIDTSIEISSQLNALFLVDPNAYAFTPGSRYDGYGNETCQTPLWVRPPSLQLDHIDGLGQIVGHTRQQHGIVQRNPIVYIDVLDNLEEHLTIEG